MAWVRSGECCKCGDCCRGNPRPTEWADAPNGDCPLLGILRTDGTRLCRGHGVNDYYLSGCVSWPSVPAHIQDYARCTYKFEWVEDGR